MIVTKKAMSRRTVLRGLGTALSLPLLDAMVPALTALQNTPAKAVPRLGVVYHPNGVIYDRWLPASCMAKRVVLFPCLRDQKPDCFLFRAVFAQKLLAQLFVEPPLRTIFALPFKEKGLFG